MSKEDLFNTLTQREKDVLHLLSKGMSNKEIAESLYLSEGTVRIYLTNAYSKLDVSSRTQAVLVIKEMEATGKLLLGFNKVNI